LRKLWKLATLIALFAFATLLAVILINVSNSIAAADELAQDNDYMYQPNDYTPPAVDDFFELTTEEGMTEETETNGGPAEEDYINVESLEPGVALIHTEGRTIWATATHGDWFYYTYMFPAGTPADFMVMVERINNNGAVQPIVLLLNVEGPIYGLSITESGNFLFLLRSRRQNPVTGEWETILVLIEYDRTGYILNRLELLDSWEADKINSVTGTVFLNCGSLVIRVRAQERTVELLYIIDQEGNITGVIEVGFGHLGKTRDGRAVFFQDGLNEINVQDGTWGQIFIDAIDWNAILYSTDALYLNVNSLISPGPHSMFDIYFHLSAISFTRTGMIARIYGHRFATGGFYPVIAFDDFYYVTGFNPSLDNSISIFNDGRVAVFESNMQTFQTDMFIITPHDFIPLFIY